MSADEKKCEICGMKVAKYKCTVCGQNACSTCYWLQMGVCRICGKKR